MVICQNMRVRPKADSEGQKQWQDLQLDYYVTMEKRQVGYKYLKDPRCLFEHM